LIDWYDSFVFKNTCGVNAWLWIRAADTSKFVSRKGVNKRPGEIADPLDNHFELKVSMQSIESIASIGSIEVSDFSRALVHPLPRYKLWSFSSSNSKSRIHTARVFKDERVNQSINQLISSESNYKLRDFSQCIGVNETWAFFAFLDSYS